MMNKKTLAPMLMIMFSVLAVVPEATPLVHAQSNATVFVDPAFNAADPGGTSTVSVSVSGVSNLIGYDVILSWDILALSAVSINCVGSHTLFSTVPSSSVFVVTQSIDNSAGQAECAAALLGGTTVNMDGPVMQVTLQSLGPFPSDLIIVNPQIISLVNGGAMPVPVTVVNGTFLSPPPVAFVSPNASPAPGEHVRFLRKGQTTIDLQGFLMLSATAPSAGWGGVIFTIVDPASNTYTVQSTINFMFPGNSTTVTGSFDIGGNNGGITGNYQIFVTLLRCPLPTSCAPGATVQGLSFKVKA